MVQRLCSSCSERTGQRQTHVPPTSCKFWAELEHMATRNSPMFCYKSSQLPPRWCEDENQLRALTGHWVSLCVLHQSHSLHQNYYFFLFAKTESIQKSNLLYLDAGHLKKESPMKTVWMNLLNGKPLPTSLNDFSCRDVFAGFASEKNRKGWGKSWFLFSWMHPSSTALLRQENDFWVFLSLKFVNST